MLIKHPRESRTVMTELVMPNDTNPLHNLMGGNLMRWMDIAGGICSRRHSGCICVTASVDNVSFDSPIRMGEIVTIAAEVTRVFNTSLEVYISVAAEGSDTTKRRPCNYAYFTFVGLDEWGNKLSLPQLQPETEKEQQQFEGALRRREMRLILAGKLKPQEATQLKSLFV
ncbi:MAG TPA: acyl-CoA thioesterase [Chitinophagales bacterium]|jgi:acyl-CoA hydrolase|nr:acyl-CoA thioesterase [Chitinophagales bacterium]HNL07249.1 acyl-CoA thioesterase [Chitinophagales bacterium]